MLGWAMAFLVIALLTAFLGFGAFEGFLGGVMKTLCFLFLLAFCIAISWEKGLSFPLGMNTKPSSSRAVLLTPIRVVRPALVDSPSSVPTPMEAR